jgi:DNA-binding PadR family transcriptional regulator
MKKLVGIATIIFTLGLVFSSVSAQTGQGDEIKNVTLTEEQKKELAKLHNEVLEKKKEIVSKYIEYGVFPEEKGKKIMEKMDNRFKMLEENNYIPKWDRHKHDHH